jgi:chromosomal replication initiation ATPase DnaA
MASIASEVARKHGLTVRALKRQTTAIVIARPRQEAMARMKAAGWSNAQAAGFFGLDHTTCVHAVRKFRALAQQEAA